MKVAASGRHARRSEEQERTGGVGIRGHGGEPDGRESRIHQPRLDATGLEASIEEHRLLNDLLVHTGAEKNVKGRLDVERDFMVRGTCV